MADIDRYFDLIDGSRARRARELSNAKESFDHLERVGQKIVAGKSLIVLSYANWEGFYNECVDCLIDYLALTGIKVKDLCWSSLTGSLISSFSRLRDRNHSLDAQKEFVDILQTKLECNFVEFDRKIAKAQSNLNFERLQVGFSLLGLDVSAFQRHRNRIDRELVGWRHSIAHGDTIDLSFMKADDHASFTSEMMLSVSDEFQNAFLRFA